MARYSIEDTTLASIGDGIRKIVGDTRIESIPYQVKEYQFDVDNNTYNSLTPFTIPTGGASILRIVRISSIPEDATHTLYWTKCSTSILFPGATITTYEVYPNDGVSEVGLYTIGSGLIYNFEVHYLDADGQPMTVYFDTPVKNTLTPVEMGDILNNTSLYGEEQYHEAGDTFIRRNTSNTPLENYVNDRITKIGNYGMAGVYFRNASFPNVSELDKYAFASSGGSGPGLSSGYWGVLDIPNLERADGYVFQNAIIKTLDFPKLKSAMGYCFQNANYTTTINVPKLENVSENNIFSGCSELVELALPAIIGKLGLMNIYQCRELIKVDFGAGLTSIANYNFQYCDKLETIILRSNSVVSLTNSLSSSSSISKGVSYIYVPAAVIEDYKVAANWAPYAAQFRAIEDYPEICGEA